MTRTTRLAYLALAAVAGSQAVYAQANDATLTITGTVQTTSCFLRIAAGTGDAGGGTSGTTASISAPRVVATSATQSAAAGFVLSPISKFTVGLAATSGATAAGCTGPSTWNTAFSTATPITSVSGRQFLPLSAGGGTGAALELYSFSADGASQVQAISSYVAPTYGALNISSQTGLVSVAPTATQTFGVALVKTAAANTQLGAGNIAGVVTVSYALF